MRGRRWVAAFLVSVAVAVVASCGADTASPGAGGGTSTSVEAPAESAAAVTRIDELRARFQTAGARPVIGPGVVSSFEAATEGRARAVVPREARSGTARPARIELPGRA